MRSIVLIVLTACGAAPARVTSVAAPVATTNEIPTVRERCPVVIIDAKRVRLPWVDELVKDTDEPTPESVGALDELASVMQQHPAMHVGVVGHASEDEKTPKALAEARARRIAFELALRGVDAGRIEAHGVGTLRPIGREQNKNRYVSAEVIAYGTPLQSWTGFDYSDVPFSSDRDPCPRPR
jgi:hypothetical protein